MCPTKLAQIRPFVGAPAIHDEKSAEIVAENLPRHSSASALGNLEDSRQQRARGPEPGAFFVLTPAGLVGMHRGLAAHALAHFLDGRSERFAHLPLDVADRSQPELHPKQVRKQLLRRSLAELILPCADRDDPAQPRPGRPAWNCRGQRSLGGVPAASAALAVQPRLRHLCLHPRKFCHWVPRSLADLGSQLPRQRCLALRAHHRPVICDLIHFLPAAARACSARGRAAHPACGPSACPSTSYPGNRATAASKNSANSSPAGLHSSAIRFNAVSNRLIGLASSASRSASCALNSVICASRGSAWVTTALDQILPDLSIPLNACSFSCCRRRA